MAPDDLLLIAHQLASGVVGNRRGRPRQAELRRAVSTAYYALFHTLARCGADLVAGSTKQHRSQRAWRQAYRALDHGETRKRCTQKTRLAEFPTEIQVFADAFLCTPSEVASLGRLRPAVHIPSFLGPSVDRGSRQYHLRFQFGCPCRAKGLCRVRAVEAKVGLIPQREVTG